MGRPKRRGVGSFHVNVVAPWNATAADEDTLLNYWVVDEAKTCVKVYQRFTSSAAALAQFTTNDGWAKLDNYLEPADVCFRLRQ